MLLAMLRTSPHQGAASLQDCLPLAAPVKLNSAGGPLSPWALSWQSAWRSAGTRWLFCRAEWLGSRLGNCPGGPTALHRQKVTHSWQLPCQLARTCGWSRRGAGWRWCCHPTGQGSWACFTYLGLLAAAGLPRRRATSAGCCRWQEDRKPLPAPAPHPASRQLSSPRACALCGPVSCLQPAAVGASHNVRRRIHGHVWVFFPHLSSPSWRARTALASRLSRIPRVGRPAGGVPPGRILLVRPGGVAGCMRPWPWMRVPTNLAACCTLGSCQGPHIACCLGAMLLFGQCGSVALGVHQPTVVGIQFTARRVLQAASSRLIHFHRCAVAHTRAAGALPVSTHSCSHAGGPVGLWWIAALASGSWRGAGCRPGRGGSSQCGLARGTLAYGACGRGQVCWLV